MLRQGLAGTQGDGEEDEEDFDEEESEAAFMAALGTRPPLNCCCDDCVTYSYPYFSALIVLIRMLQMVKFRCIIRIL